ncbi:MAG: hypothetical protein J6S67_07780 [Methanobrevibacter sp.]|nr:hypothetical protein [Methanobrevibacter sp.]
MAEVENEVMVTDLDSAETTEILDATAVSTPKFGWKTVGKVAGLVVGTSLLSGVAISVGDRIGTAICDKAEVWHAGRKAKKEAEKAKKEEQKAKKEAEAKKSEVETSEEAREVLEKTEQ